MKNQEGRPAPKRYKMGAGGRQGAPSEGLGAHKHGQKTKNVTLKKRLLSKKKMSHWHGAWRAHAPCVGVWQQQQSTWQHRIYILHISAPCVYACVCGCVWVCVHLCVYARTHTCVYFGGAYLQRVGGNSSYQLGDRAEHKRLQARQCLLLPFALARNDRLLHGLIHRKLDGRIAAQQQRRRNTRPEFLIPFFRDDSHNHVHYTLVLAASYKDAGV